MNISLRHPIQSWVFKEETQQIWWQLPSWLERLNTPIASLQRDNTHQPVSRDYRIHKLFLYRGLRHTYECPGYDTKESDGEASGLLELWGMWSTLLLPLLPVPLWPGVVAPNRVLSMGQIELKCVLGLNWISWDRTVLKFKLSIYTKLTCLK